jgi:hypothetical protein
MAELKLDEESWSSRLYIRCVEREHHDVRRAGRKFSRHTIRQVEISPSALTADPAIPI